MRLIDEYKRCDFYCSFPFCCCFGKRGDSQINTDSVRGEGEDRYSVSDQSYQ